MSKYNITFADINTTVNVPRGTRIVEVAEKLAPVSRSDARKTTVVIA